jgi:hypothetical protein
MMRAVAASEVTKKQFTPRSWAKFVEAKGRGDEVVIISDTIRKGRLDIQDQPFQVVAAYKEHALFVQSEQERWQEIGYIAIDMKA